MNGPCIAQFMLNDAYCVLARTGERRWVDIILAWEPGPGAPEVSVSEGSPLTPEEVARRRRAAKPRVALGTRHPAKPKGG